VGDGRHDLAPQRKKGYPEHVNFSTAAAGSRAMLQRCCCVWELLRGSERIQRNTDRCKLM
jgi:hypothetical protein